MIKSKAKLILKKGDCLVSMNYNEAEKYIHSFTRFGSRLGLERMSRFLERLGNPQDKLRFIHIAGSNGKGSTTKMSATVLQEAGYKVGMYISPFVVDFRERFQINGKMIPKEKLTALVERVAPIVAEMAEQGDQITEFEVVTAIAFLYFYEEACDIVCLEVGLGGRFDATNVIKTPLVAIITSISMDHSEILGDTIAKIAFEKAGVIKENTEVVTYPLQSPDAVSVFMEACSKTNSRLLLPNPAGVEIKRCDVYGARFVYNEKEYTLKLAGRHQIYNAVAVIEAVKLLNKKGFSISEEAISRGIANAKFPARFERMSKEPLIIVDGAHDRQATQALSQTLEMLKASPKIAVMGMMADKEYSAAVSFIAQVCSSIITVPVDNPRALSAEDLARSASEVCKSVFPINDYMEALSRAVELAGENGAVIVCGSFYMASDMRKTIKEYLKKQQG